MSLLAIPILLRRHMIPFLKYLIKVCTIGKLQFCSNLGHTFFRVTKQIRGSTHRKVHAVVKQALTGIFLYYLPKVSPVIIQDTGQFFITDASPMFLQKLADSGKQQRIHAAFCCYVHYVVIQRIT